MTGRSVLDVSVVPAERDDLGALLGALLSVDGVERGERLAVPTGEDGRGAAAVDPPAAGQLRLYVSVEPAAALAPVVALLGARGAGVRNVHLGTPSLEDVFIGLTGRGLR